MVASWTKSPNNHATAAFNNLEDVASTVSNGELKFYINFLFTEESQFFGRPDTKINITFEYVLLLMRPYELSHTYQ